MRFAPLPRSLKLAYVPELTSAKRLVSEGVANITRCYSTGNIEGPDAGGICGGILGNQHGKVCVI